MPISDAPHATVGPSDIAPAVLVASEHLVARWSEQASAPADFIAVVDTDAQHALEIIRRHNASVVVLEQVVSASAKGLALVQALRSNREFDHLDIRMLPEARAGALGHHATGRALAHMSTPLGRQPSRRVRRLALKPGTRARLNGSDVDLVELSVSGAHVISSAIVKPHENVWIVIARAGESHRAKGTVAWSRAEFDAHRLCYHAGVAFAEECPDLLACLLAQVVD